MGGPPPLADPIETPAGLLVERKFPRARSRRSGRFQPIGGVELRTDQPQSQFDDLYTVVYALIDDAKARYRVVKLYKGSYGSADPHPVVLDYGEFFATHRRGVLGYACDRARPGTDRYRMADLDEYDRCANPRVPVRKVFDLLAHTGRRDGETDDDYLTYVANRRHRLGAYRGGSSGLDDESRACAAAYFQHLGLRVGPGEVLVFCGGFKGALISACAAVMSSRRHDELHHIGGRVLAPVGYYQSLRLIPTIFGGGLDVVADLDGDTVSEWLTGTHGRGGRIVYVPLVNNVDGRVLSRARACSIAAVVLDHNQRHPVNPVWVVADDVYAGSYLSAGLSPQPIGALSGMGDWTVSITTPSKTVALATARVAFATTISAGMRAALAHYRTVFSFGRVPQAGELSGVAALCLTPQSWIEHWNTEYRRRLALLTTGLEGINAELGAEVYRIQHPEGGWYFALRVTRDLFPREVSSGVHAAAVLLNYGQDRRDTGIAMLPGELFGYNLDGPQRWLTLRGSLAVTPTHLQVCVQRLREVALLVRGPRGPATVNHTLSRTRAVADLDRIVTQRRY
jgi:aspartate/methionine/tyrosine aminotransferase